MLCLAWKPGRDQTLFVLWEWAGEIDGDLTSTPRTKSREDVKEGCSSLGLGYMGLQTNKNRSDLECSKFIYIHPDSM